MRKKLEKFHLKGQNFLPRLFQELASKDSESPWSGDHFYSVGSTFCARCARYARYARYARAVFFARYARRLTKNALRALTRYGARE